VFEVRVAPLFLQIGITRILTKLSVVVVFLFFFFFLKISEKFLFLFFFLMEILHIKIEEKKNHVKNF